jgi:hypothetical protein
MYKTLAKGKEPLEARSFWLALETKIHLCIFIYKYFSLFWRISWAKFSSHLIRHNIFWTKIQTSRPLTFWWITTCLQIVVRRRKEANQMNLNKINTKAG